MYTRCFERESFDGNYEVINISDYGYEYYVDNNFEDGGLVEDVEETIEMLLEAGWEEVK
jgi:hypothetical protein